MVKKKTHAEEVLELGVDPEDYEGDLISPYQPFTDKHLFLFKDGSYLVWNHRKAQEWKAGKLDSSTQQAIVTFLTVDFSKMVF